MEEIRNIGLNQEGKVTYAVEVANGVHIGVESFEDLRDGKFEELAHFGKIPSDEQREIWIRTNGLQRDKQYQDTVLRHKTEGDIPQKGVTADDVKEIIRQERKTVAVAEEQQPHKGRPKKSVE